MSRAAAALAQVAPDIPIPPELPVEHIDAYIADARERVAKGADAEQLAREYSSTVRQFREAGIDPFDPSLYEGGVTLEEARRLGLIEALEDDVCGSSS
jgi:hypothetical protein